MKFNFSTIASKLSVKGWIAVGTAVLVGIVFVVLLFTFASSPSYSTLMAGIAPAQTGKITNALSTAGINYQLQSDGTAVAVQSSQVSRARVVLDQQGLLNGTGTSSSLEKLIGKSSLGESDSQQQNQLTSALEQQVQQQIDSISGVNSAQVTLAIPSQTATLFASSATTPSASVLLNTTGTLGSSTVRSIASLVSSSVTGLTTSHVSISDQNGDALWPNNSSSSASTKESTEQAYDQWAANKADAMLAATLGTGKATVQVASDINANKQTLSQLTYGTKGTPLSTTSTQETLTSTDGGTAASGSTATQDASSYAANGSTTPTNYKSKSSNSTYGVNKTVSQETVAPGAVNRQTIALMVSSSVPKNELGSIENAVKNALGFQAGRDQMSVSSLPFAKVTAASGKSTVDNMLGYAKYLILGLAALLFLLLIARMLRRRERELVGGQPVWVREYQQARSLAEIQAERQASLDEPVQITQLRPPVNIARKQIEDLVDRDPERVAAQVRQWLGED